VNDIFSHISLKDWSSPVISQVIPEYSPENAANGTDKSIPDADWVTGSMKTHEGKDDIRGDEKEGGGEECHEKEA